MDQTRREILDDFLGFVTEAGDSTARDIAERALNRAVLSIWMYRAWSQFLAAAPYTFATVAGTRAYALPSYFGRITSQSGQIRNVTNGSKILPVERQELEAMDPVFGTALESLAMPRRYVVDGAVGVHTQPASAGELCEVVSSSGLDLTVLVYVEGINSTDQYTRAQVTLNGLTPVSVGSWKRIEAFGKSYPASLDPTTELTSSAGSVTLRTTAAATELQVLLADESAVQLPQLTLYPTPDAVYTISVPYLRAPRRLFQDADPLPRFWGPAIFEQLCAQWQVQRGNAGSLAAIPTPALTQLVEFENMAQAQSKRQRQPFTGGYR